MQVELTSIATARVRFGRASLKNVCIIPNWKNPGWMSMNSSMSTSNVDLVQFLDGGIRSDLRAAEIPGYVDRAAYSLQINPVISSRAFSGLTAVKFGLCSRNDR